MYYESTIIDPYHNESYYETHSIVVQLERNEADEVGAACFHPEMISCREQRGQSCGMLLVRVVSPPKICE